MSASLFPVPNPLPSVWTEEPHVLDDYRTADTLSGECDITIIGTGFSGVSTAYQIVKSSSAATSVVLLEARLHCSGATGRNGGHVKPDTYYSTTKYERIYGTEQASKLQKFESSQVLAVKELVESEGLDCDFHVTRAVDVYMDPDHARQTYDAYLKLRSSGRYDLKDVAYTDSSSAERVSCIKLNHSLITFSNAKTIADFRSEGCSVLFQLHCSTPLAEKVGTGSPPAPYSAKWREGLCKDAGRQGLRDSR